MTCDRIDSHDDFWKPWIIAVIAVGGVVLIAIIIVIIVCCVRKKSDNDPPREPLPSMDVIDVSMILLKFDLNAENMRFQHLTSRYCKSKTIQDTKML